MGAMWIEVKIKMKPIAGFVAVEALLVVVAVVVVAVVVVVVGGGGGVGVVVVIVVVPKWKIWQIKISWPSVSSV